MKQPLNLPEVVSAFLAATKNLDTIAMLGTFSADAVLKDEGKSYTGATEIQSWSDRQFLGVKVTLSVIKTVVKDHNATLTIEVDGDFEAAYGITEPFLLDFDFTIEGGKIIELDIAESKS